jgi:hypothetical protein
LYIYYGARYAYTYYSPEYDISAGDVVYGNAHRQNPENYIAELMQLQGQERVWLLFSHHCAICNINEDDLFLENLDQMGSRLDEYKGIGSYAVLYDLSYQELGAH